MRVAFLGTTGFAATVLRRLAGSRFGPAIVVSPPDRPRGRGRRLAPAPVAAAAAELGLPLHRAESVNRGDAVDAIRAAAPDVGLVCAFGQLIKPPLLDELPLLNVHPSLLPRWRGAAPIERAILAGDAETGVSVMRVTAGLDSGPVALRRAVPIAPGEDCGSLSARLGELGGELAVEALELREQGRLELAEQDPALASYAEKIDPSERRLDPGRPAAELERTVRALTPHIGAHLELADGSRLGVRAAEALGDGPAGGEVEARDGMLAIGCADGALRLLEVQPQGGRRMPASDYLRGHPAPALAGP